MKSTRLPGKILLPLPFNDGKPLLKWITDALKESKYEKEIMVATSLDTENDVLEAFCEKEAIGIFRGHENNVLSRFIAIIKKQYFDVVVRLTADNPILDIGLLDNVIEQHYTQQKDYTKTEGLPLGMNFEVINPQALLGLEWEEPSEQDKEHVTLFLRAGSTNQLNLKLGGKESEKLRLTVDYPSDYAVLSFVMLLLDEDKPSFEKVKNIAKAYPWVFQINELNVQKKQYLSDAEERADAISFLRLLEFNRTADALASIKINSDLL